jgi:hypothetical protein
LAEDARWGQAPPPSEAVGLVTCDWNNVVLRAANRFEGIVAHGAERTLRGRALEKPHLTPALSAQRGAERGKSEEADRRCECRRYWYYRGNRFARESG